MLARSDRADGGKTLQPLASFMSNPAGTAIVNAVGPIRQLVQGGTDAPHRYFVILEGTTDRAGKRQYRCRRTSGAPLDMRCLADHLRLREQNGKLLRNPLHFRRNTGPSHGSAETR
jgi:hypothetical protein